MDEQKLTGDQQVRLMQALAAAFPGRGALTRLVLAALDQSLDVIAPNEAGIDMVMVVVMWAATRNKLDMLIQKALEVNPTQELQKFAADVELLETPMVTSPLSSEDKVQAYKALHQAYENREWHTVVASATALLGYRNVDELAADAQVALDHLKKVRDQLGEAYLDKEWAQVIRLAWQLGTDMSPTITTWVAGAWGQVPIDAQVLRGHEEGVLAVAVSADGQHIVSGSDDGTARLWGSASDKPLWIAPKRDAAVSAVAVSADGQHLVCGFNDGTVQLWRPGDDEPLWTVLGHKRSVVAVAVSADGQHVISGSDDRTVRRWRPTDDVEVWIARGHGRPVGAVAVSADGQLVVSGSNDGTVRRWQPADGKPAWLPREPGRPVLTVSVSADGQHVISGSDDATVQVWRLADGSPLQTVHGNGGPVWTVAVSTDGQLVVSGSPDGAIQLWRLADGSPLRTLRGHEGWVWAVAMSVAGRLLVSGGEDGTVRLWRFQAGVLG